MEESTKLARGDRVSIDKGVHQFYKDLAEKSTQNPVSAPFYLMKDIFMWAVALGVHKGARKPLAKKLGIFRWDQLSPDIDVPMLRAISIAETGDVDIISHDDQMLRIAEEYANSGISELKQIVSDNPGRALWNLVDVIRKE